MDRIMAENENTKIVVEGIVNGNLAGICSMIQYSDKGARPGSISFQVGSKWRSTVEVVGGLCEHEVTDIREPVAPRPEPIRQPLPTLQTKPLTVQSILATVEKRTAKARTVLPKEDAPVDEATIKLAAIPPRIKSNIATAPAATQAAAKVPLEQRFDGDLEGYSQAEIEELMRGPREVESVGDGEPLSPFDSSFSASPAQQQPTRKAGKPVSRFDM